MLVLLLSLLFTPASLAASPAAAPAGLHFVLVAGYQNEKIEGYLTENARILREEGAVLVDTLYPPSEHSVRDNAEVLASQLATLSKASLPTGETPPLVVIAHSKGGLETLHALLRHPELPVVRALLVQAPVGGSPVADEILLRYDTTYAWNPAYWWVRAQYAGLQSLQTAVVAFDLASSFAPLSQRERDALSARVFYVRAAKDPARVSPSLREYAPLLRPFTAHDGLVPTDRMLLPAFGQDLGVEADLDHLEGFATGPDPRKARLARIRAFTKRLLNFSLHGL